MLKKNVIRFVTGILCLFALAGCGSGGDSNTNGTLVLTVGSLDDTGGRFTVTSTATYTNSTSTSLTGVPVKIVTTIHTLTGTPQVITENHSTDSAGTVVSIQHILQTTENIFVDVTATTGGLTQSQSATVPHL